MHLRGLGITATICCTWSKSGPKNVPRPSRSDIRPHFFRTKSTTYSDTNYHLLLIYCTEVDAYFIFTVDRGRKAEWTCTVKVSRLRNIDIPRCRSVVLFLEHNRSTVICPIIDVISDDTFEYITGSDMTWGGFNWKMNFRWYSVPQREIERRHGDRSLPLRY